MMFQARDAGPLQVYRGDPLQRGAGRPRQALLPSSEYSPCYVSLSFFPFTLPSLVQSCMPSFLFGRLERNKSCAVK